MSEEGPQRMLPMLWKEWDTKGVSSLRALMEYSKDPSEAYSRNEKKDKVVRIHFGKLRDRVTSILRPFHEDDGRTEDKVGRTEDKVSLSGGCFTCSKPAAKVGSVSTESASPAVARDSNEATKEATKVQLEALAAIYEKLQGSKQLRSAVAYRRMLSDNAWEHKKTSRYIQCYYLVFPCFMFFCAFALQSFLLHLTTHFYIFYMDEEVKAGITDPGHARLFDLVGNTVGFTVDDAPSNHTGGAIERGKIKIPTKILDASGFIPFMLCVSAYLYSAYKGRLSIGFWDKTVFV
mmetsp:Transcript_86742/g.250555  ORF Transcript_86742/g.250555 Transcript_86742/m.250555 type:complete len:291 (-) Transcript_86742:9-881(-)